MKKYLAIFVFVRFFSPNSTQANSFAQIAPSDDADFFYPGRLLFQYSGCCGKHPTLFGMKQFR